MAIGLGVWGCNAEESADIGEAPLEGTEGVSLNGVSLNGVSLNGVSLNGVSLNGVSLNGVSLNGVSLNGVGLNGLSLNGSQLVGKKGTTTLRDVAFVGATFTGQLSNLTTLPLRIDSMVQGAAPNQDVWMAGVSYQGSGGWSPLCGVDAANGNAPVLSIPLAGTWNYMQGVLGGGAYFPDATHVTFACRKTAIAKCVELGYKPWSTVSGVNLTNHLVACTRLLRADYCGDGTPHTVNGTVLNMYDALGIQTDTEAWTPEAEWNAFGARCMTSKATSRYQLIHGAPPICSHFTQTASCASPPLYSAGTLLVDEYVETLAPASKK